MKESKIFDRLGMWLLQVLLGLNWCMYNTHKQGKRERENNFMQIIKKYWHHKEVAQNEYYGE